MPFEFTVTPPRPDAWVNRASERWRSIQRRRFEQFMKDSERAARQRVSGSVLKVRSGRLRASITSSVTEDDGGLAGRLGTDVVYGPIHEFGGTIPAHMVFPSRSKVLVFQAGGQTVFTRYARIPAIQMPARPYLRPSLQENLPILIQRLKDDAAAMDRA